MPLKPDADGEHFYLGTVVYMRNVMRHGSLDEPIATLEQSGISRQIRSVEDQKLRHDIGNLVVIAASWGSRALPPEYIKVVRDVFKTFGERYQKRIQKLGYTIPPQIEGMVNRATSKFPDEDD